MKGQTPASPERLLSQRRCDTHYHIYFLTGRRPDGELESQLTRARRHTQFLFHTSAASATKGPQRTKTCTES